MIGPEAGTVGGGGELGRVDGDVDGATGCGGAGENGVGGGVVPLGAWVTTGGGRGTDGIEGEGEDGGSEKEERGEGGEKGGEQFFGHENTINRLRGDCLGARVKRGIIGRN